jgi:heptaprenyl diphosphate synthase
LSFAEYWGIIKKQHSLQVDKMSTWKKPLQIQHSLQVVKMTTCGNGQTGLVIMTIKKLALMAILTAIALIIFIVEAQIPLPVPVAGVKLGLANAVTLFALFYGVRQSSTHDCKKSVVIAASEPQSPKFCALLMGLRVKPAMTVRLTKKPVTASYLTTANVFAILLCRIILGAVFTGRPVVFVYSLAGGLLAFAAQVIVKRFVTDKQIWVCGAAGAVSHNIGQILAAMVITGTPAVAAYLPVLVVAGVLTGVLTGLIAQFTLERLHKIRFEQ